MRPQPIRPSIQILPCEREIVARTPWSNPGIVRGWVGAPPSAGSDRQPCGSFHGAEAGVHPKRSAAARADNGCGSGIRAAVRTGLGTSPSRTTSRRFASGSGSRNTRQQRIGIRVQRLLIEFVGAPARRACHIDPDAIGDVPDHPQIVRDEDHGEAELGLQVLQKVEDFSLSPRHRAPRPARRQRSASG